MKYRHTIQSSRDIDFFILINCFPVHIASFGMPLPDAVNDIKKNRELIFLISELEEKTEISVNNVYIRERLKLLSLITKQTEDFNLVDSIANYRESFETMARKGFYSFDVDIKPYLHSEGLFNPTTESGVSFKLIAKPKRILELPDEILYRLPRIKIVDFNIKRPLSLAELNKSWKNRF